MTPLQLLLALVAITVGWIVSIWRYKNLNRFPGPPLASITPLWRVYHAYFSRDRIVELELHEKYGPIVRTAPSVLSFSDPEIMRDVYIKGFHKSDEYIAHAPLLNGNVVFNIFSDPDFARHEKLRRAINQGFTMTHLAQYETKINSMIELLIRRLQDQIGAKDTSHTIDIYSWMMYFATDVVGELTYSEPYGLLEAGKDTLGIMDTLINQNRRVSVLNKWPLLDYLWRRNPVWLWANKKGYFMPKASPIPLLIGALSKRLKLQSSANNMQDLIGDVLAAQKQNPDIVTDRAILGIALAIVNAGSDTTAITGAMLFYYLLKTPGSYEKLSKDIASLFAQGSTAESFTYNDAQQLPYLDACIKETFRIHPGSSNFQERIVPPQGETICGAFIEGGTVVGTSAVVVNREKALYGHDADAWRPERWLEANEEHRKRMASRLFHFGAGSSQCLGKNIVLLELYKVVPTLLHNFEFELANPMAKPTIENCNFYHVRDISVVMRRRWC